MGYTVCATPPSRMGYTVCATPDVYRVTMLHSGLTLFSSLM